MIIHNVPGNADAFNALIYKPPDNNVISYINNHMAKGAEVIGDVSSRFMDTTKNLYDKFNSYEVINRAKSILASAGVSMSPTAIYRMGYDNLHESNYMMQQYIIAEPTINKMVQDDLLFGYQDTYFNTEPETFGTNRNDYRRVMDGVVQYEDGVAYTKRYYNGDEVDDLYSVDQFSILDTWDVAKLMLNNDIDPTSPDRDEI